MSQVVPGRVTFDHDGDVVVFQVGMRVNRFRSVRRWWPVLVAMPKMLRELQTDASLGLLATSTVMQGPRRITVLQHWRDLESLLAYATAGDRAHHPAWAAFNRAVRESRGAVGIWHETYVVPAKAYEAVYVDMPAHGLGAAFGTTAATGRKATAAGRLGRPELSTMQD